MVKLIFLCRRKPELSHAQYVERLLGGHVPLAIRHHPTMTKYVVNIVADSPAGEVELDSIGELSFASLDDFRTRLYDSEEGRKVIDRDVACFLGSASAYLVAEHVQKNTVGAVALGQPTPGTKLFCPLIRRPDLTHEQFVAHWLGTHVPLALRHHPGMTRYKNNVVDQTLTSDATAWDGFAEIQLGVSGDWHHGLFDNADGERIVRDDIARFIGRTGAYRCTEYVQKV
jgi:hypothetical protein